MKSKIVVLVVLMLTLGGVFGGCALVDTVVDKTKGYVIDLTSDKLNGLSKEKYEELKTYLSLKGMSITDLDKNMDQKITIEELNALPGMLIMNPKTATDWEFWELLLMVLVPTYGHRGLRKIKDKMTPKAIE